MTGLMVSLLEVLAEKGPLAPGDAVSLVGAPRYRVLAAFHCLEELGLAAPLYSKGSYKIYSITEQGRAMLRIAGEEGSLALALGKALEALYTPAGKAGAGQASAVEG
ncbi:MAG: hypothetical protein LRS48_00140 [Desulfurococcales archaeon]|nr:hypothetical protein [Desulfurococcales archaeon]